MYMEFLFLGRFNVTRILKRGIFPIQLNEESPVFCALSLFFFISFSLVFHFCDILNKRHCYSGQKRVVWLGVRGEGNNYKGT